MLQKTIPLRGDHRPCCAFMARTSKPAIFPWTRPLLPAACSWPEKPAKSNPSPLRRMVPLPLPWILSPWRWYTTGTAFPWSPAPRDGGDAPGSDLYALAGAGAQPHCARLPEGPFAGHAGGHGGLADDLVRLGRSLERSQDADPVRDATTAPPAHRPQTPQRTAPPEDDHGPQPK